MATAGGPDIERSGLVFGYDTSYGTDTNNISSRFYSGEPATNLFTVLGAPSNTDQDVTFAVQGTGVFKRVAVGTKIGNYTVRAEDVVYSYALGGTGCHYHGNDYGTISSGTKVSLNIEYFLSSEVSIVTNYLGAFEQLPGVAGSWGSVNPETDKWHRVSLTRTASGTGNLRMLMYPGACSSSTLSNQGTIYFKNPTVTLTAQPTPFVNGTRSSTQSLIDLTRTTNIDVSNVSFDSTGQPTFDGTDDRIDSVTGVGITDYSQPFTMECVFMVPTGATWANAYNSNIFSIAGGYAGQYGFYKYGTDGVGFQIRDATSGTYPATTGLLRDTYYHITAVFQGGSGLTLYRNGVSVSTSTTSFTGAPDTPNLYIGGVRAFSGNTGTWFQGEIPVAKYYNRALTAQEVQQNYNAYKNRFNL